MLLKEKTARLLERQDRTFSGFIMISSPPALRTNSFRRSESTYKASAYPHCSFSLSHIRFHPPFTPDSGLRVHLNSTILIQVPMTLRIIASPTSSQRPPVLSLLLQLPRQQPLLPLPLPSPPPTLQTPALQYQVKPALLRFQHDRCLSEACAALCCSLLHNTTASSLAVAHHYCIQSSSTPPPPPWQILSAQPPLATPLQPTEAEVIALL